LKTVYQEYEVTKQTFKEIENLREDQRTKEEDFGILLLLPVYFHFLLQYQSLTTLYLKIQPLEKQLSNNIF